MSNLNPGKTAGLGSELSENGKAGDLLSGVSWSAEKPGLKVKCHWEMQHYQKLSCKQFYIRMTWPYLNLKVGVEGSVLPVVEGDRRFVSWDAPVHIEASSVFSGTEASSSSSIAVTFMFWSSSSTTLDCCSCRGKCLKSRSKEQWWSSHYRFQSLADNEDNSDKSHCLHFIQRTLWSQTEI